MDALKARIEQLLESPAPSKLANLRAALRALKQDELVALLYAYDMSVEMIVYLRDRNWPHVQVHFRTWRAPSVLRSAMLAELKRRRLFVPRM